MQIYRIRTLLRIIALMGNSERRWILGAVRCAMNEDGRLVLVACAIVKTASVEWKCYLLSCILCFWQSSIHSEISFVENASDGVMSRGSKFFGKYLMET
jgi:hypothetical protein